MEAVAKRRQGILLPHPGLDALHCPLASNMRAGWGCHVPLPGYVQRRLVLGLPGTWRDKGTLGTPGHRGLSPLTVQPDGTLWTIT